MTSQGTVSGFQIPFIHQMREQAMAFSRTGAGAFSWRGQAGHTDKELLLFLVNRFRQESSVTDGAVGGREGPFSSD